VAFDLDQNTAWVHGAVAGAGFVEGGQARRYAGRSAPRHRLFLADVVEPFGQGESGQALRDRVLFAADSSTSSSFARCMCSTPLARAMALAAASLTLK